MYYTPCCGAPAQKLSPEHYRCPKCQKNHYINPHAAVAIVLYDQDKYLFLGRRAKAPNKDKLDCIGGFLDIGENFEEAMIRELKEETGVLASRIKDLRIFGTVHDFYPWEGNQVSCATVYFLAELGSGIKLEAADDVSSIERVKLSEVAVDDLAWDGQRKMLELLKTHEAGFLYT